MTGPSTTPCRLAALLVATLVLAGGAAAAAQGPVYNLGRTPTEAELNPPDAAVGPFGEDLPRGRGTAREGEIVWLARGCAACHGSTGLEGPGPQLLQRTPGGRYPRIADAQHPFAPLIWSYINQMMPLDQQHEYVEMRRFSSNVWADSPRPCCMTPDEVYSLTAYLLHRAGIIAEDDVMDQTTLPQVRMPNRDSYVPPPFEKWKRGMRKEYVKQEGQP